MEMAERARIGIIGWIFSLSFKVSKVAQVQSRQEQEDEENSLSCSKVDDAMFFPGWPASMQQRPLIPQKDKGSLEPSKV